MERSSPLSDREAEGGGSMSLQLINILLKKKKNLAAAASLLISVRTSFPGCQQENSKLESFGAELVQKWKKNPAVPFVTGREVALLDSGVLAVCCAGMCSSVMRDSEQGDDPARGRLMKLLAQVTVLSLHRWLSHF